VLASRALYEKGWQLAVDTTQKLRESTGIDFRLLLIGDGPDLNALKTSNADKVFVTFSDGSTIPSPLLANATLESSQVPMPGSLSPSLSWNAFSTVFP
jgi:hypothetical protein